MDAPSVKIIFSFILEHADSNILHAVYTSVRFVLQMDDLQYINMMHDNRLSGLINKAVLFVCIKTMLKTIKAFYQVWVGCI